MHDVLSSWERRAVLYYLQERDERVPLDELADRLARWHDGADASTRSGDRIEKGSDDRTAARSDDRTAARSGDSPETRVEADETRQTELLHSHVLKMADFGVVEYDSGAETVSLVDDVTVSVQPPWTDRDETSARLAPARGRQSD